MIISTMVLSITGVFDGGGDLALSGSSLPKDERTFKNV